MTGIIYILTSPSGKSYIGQTIHPHKRYVCFLNINKSYGGSKIDRARKKYGPENFKYEILETYQNENEHEVFEKLNELEIYYIAKYDTFNNGYNLTKGGNYNIDEIARKEMSNGLKEYYKTHINPFKGKHHTNETKQLLSEKQKEYYKTHNSPWKNKHLSEEQRKHLSDIAKTRTGEKNPFYGKHHTDTTKEKISKNNSVPVLQIDKNTNEIINEFPSIAAAERHFGVKQGNSTIIYICKDKQKSGKKLKTWRGYKWKYKNEGSTTIPQGSTLK